MIVSLTAYGEDQYGDVDVSISKLFPHYEPSILWSQNYSSDFVRVRWDSSTIVKFTKEDISWVKQVLKSLEENLVVSGEL